MKHKKIFIRCVALFSCWWLLHACLYGQVYQDTTEQLYQLTVEEDILNLEIASIEEEKIFSDNRSVKKLYNSFASTSVITNEEIKRSGAISLVEVLRLFPELLIREKTNGNFHVSLFDGQSATNNILNYEKTNLLLTIDGIPFNDYYQGGIFWESVPVTLLDIEQIELVKTPSSVYFGDQAMAGVINLVTSLPETKGLKANGRFQGGLFNTYSYQANTSFSALDKGTFKISAFYQSRDRLQDEYFVMEEGRYVASDSLLFYESDVEKTNTFTNEALSSFGINGFGEWKVNDHVKFKGVFSNINSTLQSELLGLGGLRLSGRSTKYTRVQLNSNIYGIQSDFSYQSGLQDLGIGYGGLAMDFDKLYFSTDYLMRGKYASLRLGGSYQNVIYNNLNNGESLSSLDYRDMIAQGSTTFSDYGFYINPLIRAWEGKFQASIIARGDYLENINLLHPSFQLGLSYATSKNSLLRMVASSGYQTPSLMQKEFESTVQIDGEETIQQILPSEIISYELGWRYKPVKELLIDLTCFHHQGTAWEMFSSQGYVLSTLERTGITIAPSYGLPKFRLGSAFTYLYNNEWKYSSTNLNRLNPSILAGVFGSYTMFLNKLLIGWNYYFYNHYEFEEYGERWAFDSKGMLDMKVGYSLLGEHSLFIKGKNLLNNQDIEFPFADRTGRTIVLGIDLVF